MIRGVGRSILALASTLALAAGCASGTTTGAPGTSSSTSPPASSALTTTPATSSTASASLPPTSTFETTATYGLAVTFPSDWMELGANEALALTGGFFAAERPEAGVAESERSMVEIRFWSTARRGSGVALDAIVTWMKTLEVPPSFEQMGVGRVAVAEVHVDDWVKIIYAFTDPRLADLCGTRDGGYWLLFSFRDGGSSDTNAREAADAIVRSIQLVAVDPQTRDDLQAYVCRCDTSWCATSVDESTPSPAASEYQILAATPRTLDDAGALDLSLALTADGRPVVAYGDASGHLRLYSCADAACSNGTTQELGVDTGVMSTALAIGLDGNPRIAYYDGMSGDIKLYVCTTAGCSSGATWRLTSVGGFFGDPDIAIRPDGVPVISFWSNEGRDLALYVCADPACTTGTVRALDPAVNTGSYYDATSITIGADGNPVISYRDGINRDLKVYACSNPGCSAGTARTVDSVGIIGRTSSIAIGIDGNPLVAYKDDTHQRLRLLACLTPSCSEATAQTLDADDVGDLMSIAIGAGGSPVISHNSARSANFFWVYACASSSCEPGTDWLVVDDVVIAGQTAIAVDRRGSVAIAYGDGGHLRLIVVAADMIGS